MYRFGVAAMAVAVLRAGGIPAEGAHPIHTTMMELTYDDATRTVRASVRAFADDFSAAVARETRTPVAADHRVADATSYAYLARAISITDRAGHRLTMSWCGARRSGDVYWFCLRAANPLGLAGALVINRAHFELYSDQVNIVQATVGGRRFSTLFVRDDSAKVLVR